jgi:NAD(P)-dependent dehydrogenase (short-subunit alcohol dehydrogenase family)
MYLTVFRTIFERRGRMTNETLHGVSGNRAHTLAGKVAIVTGGSRGIGRAIALRLAQERAHVVVAARDQAALAAVVDEIFRAGSTAELFAADLRDPETPPALVQAAVRAYGGIDIVVNNAGATRRGDFLELSEADWKDGFELKLFGAVRLTRAAWPYLKQRKGSVLNIIGVGGRTPGPDFTIGGSVNGACLSFTKALADIGIRDGVQVNAINPGYVRTDRLQHWLKLAAAQHGGNLEAAAQDMVAKAKVSRLGEPEEVASLASFVLSSEGRFFQGALIDLDGGLTKTV